MITGRFARASRAAAAATAAASPRTRGATRVGVIRSISPSALRMSPGKRQEHRPGGRRQRGLDGAVHQPRQVGEAMHLGRPFDERTRQRREVGREHRLGDEIFEILLAGGDENGRCRLHRVVEHAHGVAEPGRDMEIEHGELARRLRVAVGHRHQRSFLQAEHVSDVVLDREGVHQRQLGGAGIAEHQLDALLSQQIEEGTLSGHHGQDRLHGFEAGNRAIPERAGTIAIFGRGRKRGYRGQICRHSGAGRRPEPGIQIYCAEAGFRVRRFAPPRNDGTRLRHFRRVDVLGPDADADHPRGDALATPGTIG